jgi:hypothetical protein
MLFGRYVVGMWLGWGQTGSVSDLRWKNILIFVSYEDLEGNVRVISRWIGWRFRSLGMLKLLVLLPLLLKYKC